MRTLLILLLLLMFTPSGQNGAVSDKQAGAEAVVVLESNWTRSRQAVATPETPTTPPAQAMIPANKKFEREKRDNGPAGVTDPNEETMDGRRAAMETMVQKSRAPKPKAADGFAYNVRVRNAGAKAIEVLFWEYQFKEAANPSNVVRRQFLCGVNIKPDKEKELRAFSLSGPSDVISVGSLTGQPGALFNEKVVINRVEYADGTIWQRKDWNFAEMKQAIARAIATPWGSEMCRGL
jgi:hypothetical protein